MEFESLKLSIDETVATIAFSRPEVMNAFNTQQIIDLNEATEIVKNDSSIRVLVLTGEGKGFTSGADLSENDPTWKDTKDALMRGYFPSINNIISMPKIVIGSINGPAAGIGAAYAMACDLRIMSEEAFILSVFSNIALVLEILDIAKHWNLQLRLKKLVHRSAFNLELQIRCVLQRILKVKLKNGHKPSPCDHHKLCLIPKK